MLALEAFNSSALTLSAPAAIPLLTVFHYFSHFSLSANVSCTNGSNSIATSAFQISDVNIFYTLRKKTMIRIIGPRPSLSHLYAWLIYTHLHYFFEFWFLQNSPQTKFPSSRDTGMQLRKTIPCVLTCIVMQPDLKFLVAAGSCMKPEGQHRPSNLLCGSPWFSRRCLEWSLPLQSSLLPQLLLLSCSRCSTKQASMALDVQS